MSDTKQWLRDSAQRIAEHNDGTWCSKSWRIIADAFELVGDDPDGKLDLVAVMFDEISSLTARLAAAEAANAELAASAVDGVKYRGLVNDYNQVDAQLAECRRLLREFTKPARRWSQTEWLVVIADKDFEAAKAAGV